MLGPSMKIKCMHLNVIFFYNLTNVSLSTFEWKMAGLIWLWFGLLNIVEMWIYNQFIRHCFLYLWIKRTTFVHMLIRILYQKCRPHEFWQIQHTWDFEEPWFWLNRSLDWGELRWPICLLNGPMGGVDGGAGGMYWFPWRMRDDIGDHWLPIISIKSKRCKSNEGTYK